MKPCWLSMTRIRLVAGRWTAIYRDRETLHSTEQVLFRLESPEFRNWIAAAGLSFNTVFWGAVSDEYQKTDIAAGMSHVEGTAEETRTCPIGRE